MAKRAIGAFLLASLAGENMLSRAITEDMEAVNLRDASASPERPRLDAYDFDDDSLEQIEQSKESFSFNADVSRLMDIIINSLYTKKDVFIRELISNASDALDKVRFIAVSDPDFLGDTPEMEIKIDFDHDEKTLSITDTGVGMSKAELIKNLGTVAKSGTTAFLEAMGQGENMSMIGQFGVGFYSAYLVANKVVVTSKSNDDEQHIWTSTADAKFYINKDPRGDTLGRGTRVTLHLKDDAVEFVEQEKIKNIVKKYSEFINYPIRLYLSKDVKEQVPIDTPDPSSAVKVTRFDDQGNEILDDDVIEEEEILDSESADDDIEITDDGEEPEADDEPVKTKTITKQVWEWQTINEIKAIWTRDKSDITEEEYNNFYKTITKDPEDPLAYTHFRAEGEIEFKSILYIPASAPFDLFENYYGKSAALKLYVRRVLITEEFEDLMPRYLNFIKGVVDSDDLPLNVSRETLQQLKMIKVMSKKLVRKAIEMVKKLAEEDEEDDDDDDEDDYDEVEEDDDEEADEEDDDEDEDDEDEDDDDERYLTFWKSFGKNIKLGVIEDSSNRSKLAKLLRFHSTEDPEGWTSLDEYISRMKEDQDTILYLSGDSLDSIQRSPILAKYVKQGYEVLILDDPIDEFTTQHLSEYEKRKVKSISKDDV
jgi:heat shock protein beta